MGLPPLVSSVCQRKFPVLKFYRYFYYFLKKKKKNEGHGLTYVGHVRSFIRGNKGNSRFIKEIAWNSYEEK